MKYLFHAVTPELEQFTLRCMGFCIEESNELVMFLIEHLLISVAVTDFPVA